MESSGLNSIKTNQEPPECKKKILLHKAPTVEIKREESFKGTTDMYMKRTISSIPKEESSSPTAAKINMMKSLFAPDRTGHMLLSNTKSAEKSQKADVNNQLQEDAAVLNKLTNRGKVV